MEREEKKKEKGKKNGEFLFIRWKHAKRPDVVAAARIEVSWKRGRKEIVVQEEARWGEGRRI